MTSTSLVIGFIRLRGDEVLGHGKDERVGGNTRAWGLDTVSSLRRRTEDCEYEMDLAPEKFRHRGRRCLVLRSGAVSPTACLDKQVVAWMAEASEPPLLIVRLQERHRATSGPGLRGRSRFQGLAPISIVLRTSSAEENDELVRKLDELGLVVTRDEATDPGEGFMIDVDLGENFPRARLQSVLETLPKGQVESWICLTPGVRGTAYVLGHEFLKLAAGLGTSLCISVVPLIP